MAIFTRTFEVQRDGLDIEIEVEFSFKGGTPDSWTEPGDPAEAEILDAYRLDNGDKVELSDAENERMTLEILENAGDYDDGDDYYDEGD